MCVRLASWILLGLLSGCAASQPVYYAEQSGWDPATELSRFSFWRLEPDSRRQERLFEIEGGWYYELSPDAKQLALINTHPDGQGQSVTDLTVRDLASGRSRVLRAGSQALSPWEVSWSPDGSRLAYLYTLAVGSKIFRNDVAMIDLKYGYSFDLNQPGQFSSISALAWSPDGRWLAMNAMPAQEKVSRLALYDLATRSWRLLPQRPEFTGGNSSSFHGELAWLPNGRHLIFTSWWSGRVNLHLYDLASETVSQLTTMAWVHGSKLSPDGKWILFRASCEHAADCGLFKEQQALYPSQLVEPIPHGFFVIRSDGTGLRKLMNLADHGELLRYDWHLSKSGLKILYSLSKASDCKFYAMNPDGGEISCL